MAPLNADQGKHMAAGFLLWFYEYHLMSLFPRSPLLILNCYVLFVLVQENREVDVWEVGDVLFSFWVCAEFPGLGSPLTLARVVQLASLWLPIPTFQRLRCMISNIKRKQNLTLKVEEIPSELDIQTWASYLPNSKVHSNCWYYKQVILPLWRRRIP